MPFRQCKSVGLIGIKKSHPRSALTNKVFFRSGIYGEQERCQIVHLGVLTSGQLINLPALRRSHLFYPNLYRVSALYVIIQAYVQGGKLKTSPLCGGVLPQPFSNPQCNHSYFWPFVLNFRLIVFIFGQSFRQDVLKLLFLKERGGYGFARNTQKLHSFT